MLSQSQLLICFVAALVFSNILDLAFPLRSRRVLEFCSAFSLLFVALTSYNVLIYPKLSPLRNLPTPVQQPLWRRLFKEPTPWLFEKWMKEIPNDGLIRYLGIFNQERLLLTNSNGVRDVLVTNPYHFHKQRAQKVHLEPVLGKGLVFVEGENHRFHRKQMSPAFATKCIRECQPLFWKKTKEIVDIFSQQISVQSSIPNAVSRRQQAPNAENSNINAIHNQISGVVEVHEPVSRAALDIIGLAGCSFDFDSLKKDGSQNQMVRDYRKAFGVSTSNRIRCLLAHVFPSWIVNNVPIQRNRDIAVVTHLVRDLASDIISMKRNQQKQQRQSPDFLDKAMQSGGFSDEVLVEQVKTLLAAGHDTTSSILASVAATLSQPQFHHVQDKVRAEIRGNLPSLSGPVLASSRDIENMPYVNAVRDEILRLFAPFSWFFRRSVVDTIICGHKVPRGTDIILCPWGMHRSTEHWGPDAETFNPDRWLRDPTGRGGARDAYCLSTFGAGPRVCIAERFAKNEISTLMAGIFGRFKVEQAEGVPEAPLSHQLTLTRMGGVRVRLTQLDDW